MLSMIQNKAKTRAEEQEMMTRNIAINAHINNKAVRTPLVEFAKDFCAQTVVASVWVAT